jgi:N-methylhydantoinase A
MRLACDTGGTFTDLVVEHDDGSLAMFKAPTTPDDPVRGVIDALSLAAKQAKQPLDAFLKHADTFMHGTTHAINAIITGRVARTAMLTTAGHRDMLVLREGGRADPFDMTTPYPEPYIPRALTFEVMERIEASGKVRQPLDEAALVQTLGELEQRDVAAIAVCLLWSIANSVHELRVGALIEKHLPGLPFTLSHQLNPTLREYRRASSTAIDASLKPLMTRYLGQLNARLVDVGFTGRILVLTSQGGMIGAEELAKAPIHVINSGPSLAPVAGRHYGAIAPNRDIIVADTGGTTYDVSLVRGGAIPLTRETWIGRPYSGHITGFPSVDVKSVGAGGGSIARVDEGGVLHVGPKSAGAVPGPVCYGRGGTQPTLTDACVALGYLDPAYFLGGTITLDRQGAIDAIRREVAVPLGCSVNEAAAAILTLATENMVQAIADITVNQGINPANALLIGGGGAAGFNSVLIARRLGIRTVVFPELGAALSAAGALMSEIASDSRATALMTTRSFNQAAANAVLDKLEEEGRAFLAASDMPESNQSIRYAVEARYEHQVWEIEVPLPARRFDSKADIDAFVEAFHTAHERIFAFRDPDSPVEVVGWSARASVRLHDRPVGRIAFHRDQHVGSATRTIYLPAEGAVDAERVRLVDMIVGETRQGPAIIETPFTTILVDTACTFELTAGGSLILNLQQAEDSDYGRTKAKRRDARGS